MQNDNRKMSEVGADFVQSAENMNDELTELLVDLVPECSSRLTNGIMDLNADCQALIIYLQGYDKVHRLTAIGIVLQALLQDLIVSSERRVAIEKALEEAQLNADPAADDFFNRADRDFEDRGDR